MSSSHNTVEVSALLCKGNAYTLSENVFTKGKRLHCFNSCDVYGVFYTYGVGPNLLSCARLY